MARARPAGDPRGRAAEDPTAVFFARERAAAVAVARAAAYASGAHHRRLVHEVAIFATTLTIRTTRIRRAQQ